jgi:signal transduction histidine kinase
LENRVLERTRELAEANESLLEQINERQSAERQRIHLLQRIVTTQEVERRRIALDIHDHLGQRLTALRLKIASLSELCSDDEQLRTRATRLQQIAELLDSEVSFLTWQLRPAALDELGLAAALETFVREWSRHFNKPAEFHVEGIRDIRLSSDAETHIYRITQEALNNISKHAEADSVSVLLERVGELLILIVEDDGVGFEPEYLERRSADKHGMGLPGMKERAELIGGQIEIESARGSGTTIYLRMPIGNHFGEGSMV